MFHENHESTPLADKFSVIGFSCPCALFQGHVSPVDRTAGGTLFFFSSVRQTQENLQLHFLFTLNVIHNI